MMEKKWNRPNERLRLLIERLFLDYQSERTMVRAFSRGATDQLAELSEKGCAEMEQHLRNSLAEIPAVDDVSRRRIKKICQDLGWITEDGQLCEVTLNDYLIDHPNFGRNFMHLDSVGLSRLISDLAYVFGNRIIYPLQ